MGQVCVQRERSDPFVDQGHSEGTACDILRSGALKIVDARWLLGQPKAYIIQRHQDLPEEAFVHPDTAADLYSRSRGLIVLSCPWLSKSHPDPTGFHMQILRLYLSKHVDAFSLPDLEDFGIFWDFASLPQNGASGTRSRSEQEAFRTGLGAINLLYGSRRTTVVQLTAMPEEGSYAQQLNLLPYWERGWCLFEATISNIQKGRRQLLDLGLEAVNRRLAEKGSDWWSVQEAAGAKRAPLVMPARMRVKLANATFTNGKADYSLVQRKYEDFFEYVTCTLDAITLRKLVEGQDWDEQEMEGVIECLPAFPKATRVALGGHCITDSTLLRVMQQLSSLKRLQGFCLSDCTGFSGQGFRALAEHPLSSLQKLFLAGTSIDNRGMCMLAAQFGSIPQLTVLHLARCERLGFPAFQALAAGLRNLGFMQELWFGGTALDDDSLHTLTEVLPSLRNLSKLDLRCCVNITTDGLPSLARCLPLMPRMAEFKLDTRSVSLFEERKSHLWYCSMCRWEVTTFNPDATIVCQDCNYGALWVPLDLRQTPEGVALVKAWLAGGRAEEQLRWCCSCSSS